MKEPKFRVASGVSLEGDPKLFLILAMVQSNVTEDILCAIESDDVSSLTLRDYRERIEAGYKFIGVGTIAGEKKIRWVREEQLKEYELTPEQAAVVADIKMRKEIGLEIK